MRYVLALTTCSAIAAGCLALAAVANEAATRGSTLITTETRVDGAVLVTAVENLSWTFNSQDGGERTVAAPQVVRWGSFAATIGGHRLRLVTGGEFIGRSVAISGNEVSLESDLLKLADLPRGSVWVVIFDMPADQQSVQDLEKRIAAAAVDADTLLFGNGDQLTGQITDSAKDNLNFKSAAADLVIDRARVAAVVFRRAKPAEMIPEGGSKVWVGLRDGSRLLARRVVVNNKSNSIELVAGSTVPLQADAIIALQPIGGDAVYLSDLKEAGYRHIPFLSLAWEYRRDENVTGGPLVVLGQRRLKGLGMHSAARITYDLDREYRAFQSELAIDDSTDGRGSVTCRVFTDDGTGKWQVKYESPVIRGGDPPVPVEVNLRGARRLSLLVDFADRGDEQDHVNWLDARLIK